MKTLLSAAVERPPAKPRDTVETPLGRIGLVVAVLPEHRREVRYLDSERETVILKASLLEVLVRAVPRRWQEKIKP